jgi:CheY-like chemotaxis protein
LAPTTDTVLLIAVDAARRDYLRLLFEGAGYPVTPAESLEEALPLARSTETSQVVILADGMQELSVLGFVSTLRNPRSLAF